MLETATAAMTLTTRILLRRMMSNVTFLALAMRNTAAVERLLLLDVVDSPDVKISLPIFF